MNVVLETVCVITLRMEDARALATQLDAIDVDQDTALGRLLLGLSETVDY